jgi:hypothetical protein
MTPQTISKIKKLIYLANTLDQKGFYREADKVDQQIIKLSKIKNTKLLSWLGSDSLTYSIPTEGSSSEDQENFVTIQAKDLTTNNIQNITMPLITVEDIRQGRVISSTKLYPNDDRYLDALSAGINNSKRRKRSYLNSIYSLAQKNEFLTGQPQEPEEITDQSSYPVRNNYSPQNQETQPETQRPPEITGEKTALVFGHSQTAGMGKDLESKLKSLGFTVTRDPHIGANDSALISFATPHTNKNWSKVFLFAGGNSTRASAGDINTLIDMFGREKVVVILPPIHVGSDRETMVRTKNQANKAGISPIPAIIVEAGPASFMRDGIHMKSGTPESIDAANQAIRAANLSSHQSSETLIT